MTTRDNAPCPEGWVPTPRANPFVVEVVVIPANIELGGRGD